MLKVISLNALLTLVITIPIVIWSSPSKAGVGFIFIVVLGIVSLIRPLFKRKKKINTLLFIGLFMTLSGCKSTHVSSNLLASRSFLNENQYPQCAFGAYGYILLNRAALTDVKAIEKLRLIAALYKSNFESQEVYIKKRINPKDLMVMYWFMKGDAVVNSDISIQQMVDNYDYARAQMILSKLDKANEEGPIFFASNQPCKTNLPEGSLVFDISKFDEDDIKKAFQTWKDRISRNPTSWRNGFKLEIFRSEFRNFVNTYGECFYKLLIGRS